MRVVPILLALSTSAFAQAKDGERAQDGLTPTDILPAGRFTGGARLAFALGEGTLEAGPASEDAELRQFLIVFEAQAGLGLGFEVEAQLPVAFSADFEVDGDGFELREEAKGLGDLGLALNYAVIRESKDDPQLFIGAFVILPTGDDDPGETELIVGNAVVTPGEEAGFGEGAFSFGFQAGVSKRMGNVEPYLLFRYLFAGTSDVDDVETDQADVGTLIFGLEIHAGEQVTVDLRAQLDFIGEEVDEDSTGAETTEEEHLGYGFQGRVYLSLGSQVALTAGAGITALEDHALDEESDFELTDTWVFGAELGLRVVFGR